MSSKKQWGDKVRDKLSDRAGPLTRADVQCSICMSIMVEPVTTPCNHSFCRKCYEKSFHDTTSFCPVCRRRLSSWNRSVIKKNDSLVDVPLWKRIQEEFPNLVEARRTEIDSQGLDEEDFKNKQTDSAERRAEREGVLGLFDVSSEESQSSDMEWILNEQGLQSGTQSQELNLDFERDQAKELDGIVTTAHQIKEDRRMAMEIQRQEENPVKLRPRI